MTDERDQGATDAEAQEDTQRPAEALNKPSDDAGDQASGAGYGNNAGPQGDDQS